MKAKGLVDIYETHMTDRKKFHKLFGLISKVVLAAYQAPSQNTFKAKLMVFLYENRRK